MRNRFAIQEDPNNPVPKEAYNWRIYGLAISAAWASAMFGYDSAFIGGTMSLPSFQESFGLGDEASTRLQSNITSTFQAGAFFGSMFGYVSSEQLGRRWNLILSGIIFIIGAVLQTASQGLGMMYGGRILTGIGVGSSSMIVPVYIAESAPHTIRGRLVGIFEMFLQVASLCGFWVNYGVDQNVVSSERQWRIPFAVQIVPAGMLIVCIAFMIESPRWLIKKGKHDLALKNLGWIRNLPTDHEYVQQEIAAINVELEAEISVGGSYRSALMASWKELIGPQMRFRLIYAAAMKWMANLTGVNAFNYFSPVIFQSIGFTGTSTGLFATGIYGIIKVVVTVFFVQFLVDTWGRRKALLTGSVIAIGALFFLGGYSKLSHSFQGEPPRDGGAYTAIVMVYVYAAAYAFSWNALPWIFAAEVFPTGIRSLAMMVCVLNQWLAQFVIVYATPYMISDFGYGVFFFFGSCTVVAAVTVYCLMPETKGFALEEMHFIFNNGTWWAPERRKRGERLRDEHWMAVTAIQVVGGKGGNGERRSVELRESV